MKLNTKKLQEGGSMPFMAYNSQLVQQDTSTSVAPPTQTSDKKEEGSNELLSKEIKNELIKKGLPNDVKMFLQQLSELESGSFNSSLDRNSVYALVGRANEIIHNANLMNDALQQAYSNDGLEELAVTATGGIYTRGVDGQINTMSLSDYKKKKDKVQALTVNDLSKARMYDKNLSYDTNVISTIQNSLGVNKISDYMLNIIGKLGTESVDKEGYIDSNKLKAQIESLSASGKKPTAQELKGIQELANTYNSLGKEGIYKMSTSSSTQRGHLKEAFEYIWSMLPNNAKNVLKARHAVDGTDYSNPMNIIQNALYTTTSESRKSSVDYDSAMNRDDKSSSDSSKTYNQSPLEKLIYGDLDVNEDIQLYNADQADYGLKLKGSLSTSLPSLTGKPIPATILSNALNNITGVDRNKMYFGNKQIQPYELDSIVYDGGMAANVWIPVNSDGSPNFEMLKNYSAAQDLIKRKGITDAKEKNDIMGEHGLKFIKFDASGKMTPMSKAYLKPFIMIHGMSTNGVGSADNNTMSHTLSGDENDNYERSLNKVFTDNKVSMPTGSFWSGGTKVVQAPIFLALSPSATNDAAHFAGKGSLLNQNTVAQDILRQPSTNVYGSSSILNE